MAKMSRFKQGTMFGSYRIDRLIGKGSYGQVYLVNDIGTPDYFALKVEHNESARNSLTNEINELEQLQESPYFPKSVTHGILFNSQYYIMELLGSSVAAMRSELDTKRFSRYTTLFIVTEMLKCIKVLHQKGFIHRDIKPSNFLLRPGKNNPICLIDFGLSVSYIDPSTNEHLPFRNDIGFVGSKRYASVNAHERNQLSRRDDMLSWFYSCVELYTGDLPWSNTNVSETIYNLKKNINPSELCSGMPSEFTEIYRRIRDLRYEDCPPYDYILRLLVNLLNNSRKSSQVLDWEYFSDERIALISAVQLNEKEDQEQNYGICRI